MLFNACKKHEKAMDPWLAFSAFFKHSKVPLSQISGLLNFKFPFMCILSFSSVLFLEKNGFHEIQGSR